MMVLNFEKPKNNYHDIAPKNTFILRVNKKQIPLWNIRYDQHVSGSES